MDRQTGEVVESYTMLTINADEHPLISQMHKPDPKFPANQQDKCSVVAIEQADIEQWLTGAVGGAMSLIKAPEMELIEAEPV